MWSKNVKEERECQKQIILGADNPDYCVLFGLGLHLESSIATHGMSEYVFNFGRSGDGGYDKKSGEPIIPAKANAFLQSTL